MLSGKNKYPSYNNVLKEQLFYLLDKLEKVRGSKMWANLRIWLKVLIGFVFSITVLATIVSYSLFGVQAEDTVRVIVTEATGPQRDVTVFATTLQPMVIHNVFWLCLAGLGFLLIFLYFIDFSFRSFLAPGFLALIMCAFVGIIITASIDHIMYFVDPYGEEYVETFLSYLRNVIIGIVIFGLVLIGLSYHGDRFLKSAKTRR